jgi:hypothetical protein
MDIRLKTAPFEWEGTVYNLCCNMNVLADVQEAFNGDLDAAVSQKSSLRGVLEFLAAMLNDASQNIGTSERFTARGLGRKLPVARRVEVQKLVMDLFLTSCAPVESASDHEGAEKNEKTSQGKAE